MNYIADTYLSWRQRQYIFDGSEEYYDPDEDDDSSSDSSSSSSSCSSSAEEENNRDKEVDEELVRVVPHSTASETSVVPSSSTNVVTNELKPDGDKSN